MGDSQRFNLFADAIATHFPDRHENIADVAGGKGYLQMALRQRGYERVTSWDKRPRNAKNRKGYRYGYFDYRSAPYDYGLAIGMHPDEGTDHIIQYACYRQIPFIVCPCCVKPSAATFWGNKGSYRDWMNHLIGLAEKGGMSVEVSALRMTGRNEIIIGKPLIKR